jgi:hypothetical protein
MGLENHAPKKRCWFTDSIKKEFPFSKKGHQHESLVVPREEN